jgi:hypothetical protein
MSDALAVSVGVGVALWVFGAYLAASWQLEKKQRKDAIAALTKVCNTSVDRAELGALLYHALAQVATADYEKDAKVRELTAQVLAKARPPA